MGDDFGPWGGATAGSPKRRATAIDLVTGLTSLSKNILALQKKIADLGTAKDGKSLRAEIKQLREDTGDLIKDIKAELQKPKTDKAKHDKLVNQFKDLLKQYEALSNESLRKEREIVASLSLKTTSPLSDAQTQDLATLGLNEVDLAIVDETNKEIKQIETELVALNEVFRDVANLVTEQGAELNKVEANIQQADGHTKGAVQQLSEAYEINKSIRKKKIVIIILIIIILGIAIGVPVGVTLGKRG